MISDGAPDIGKGLTIRADDFHEIVKGGEIYFSVAPVSPKISQRQQKTKPDKKKKYGLINNMLVLRHRSLLKNRRKIFGDIV